MAQFDRKIIGENIKALREASGLSQQDFSHLVEISRRSIANIEAGNGGNNLDLLDRISTFFNVKIADILKKEINLTLNFRENLLSYHKNNEPLLILLNKQPNITYAIKYKLLKSDFLDTPKEVNEIKSFFAQYGWKYLGTSISNALKREQDKIIVTRHELKRNTNIYSKTGKIIPTESQ
ncbi:helix-turn-helix domain-containing protein [Pedobacter hartonius]|nr:helix-turn-helix transcriptional regulator [Pedobacter hartonius]